MDKARSTSATGAVRWRRLPDSDVNDGTSSERRTESIETRQSLDAERQCATARASTAIIRLPQSCPTDYHIRREVSSSLRAETARLRVSSICMRTSQARMLTEAMRAALQFRDPAKISSSDGCGRTVSECTTTVSTNMHGLQPLLAAILNEHFSLARQ